MSEKEVHEGIMIGMDENEDYELALVDRLPEPEKAGPWEPYNPKRPWYPSKFFVESQGIDAVSWNQLGEKLIGKHVRATIEVVDDTPMDLEKRGRE
jgi:hypothetical protein